MLKVTQAWLRRKVRRAYSAAALNPRSKHAFPVGEGFAFSLGYPKDVLEKIPAGAKNAFAGVSNVSIFADIPAGSAVLDLGCGAGLDTLIAADRTGPNGRVIAVDFGAAMIDRARVSAEELGARNVELREADAEDLPIADESVDVALVNGIFNLNPARQKIFQELFRVLRPGGSVFGAELILREGLRFGERRKARNWLA